MHYFLELVTFMVLSRGWNPPEGGTPQKVEPPEGSPQAPAQVFVFFFEVNNFNIL